MPLNLVSFSLVDSPVTIEEGRKILKESGLKFEVGATMKEAADLAVAAAKG